MMNTMEVIAKLAV